MEVESTSIKEGDFVVYKKDRRFKGTVVQAGGDGEERRITVKVERTKDKTGVYDGLFDYLFNYSASDFERGERDV